MNWHFVPGEHYNRRAEIHQRYGGQQQNGIVTPAYNRVRFVFTGRGDQRGYADEWLADGALRYSGEGQLGDMRIVGASAQRDLRLSAAMSGPNKDHIMVLRRLFSPPERYAD